MSNWTHVAAVIRVDCVRFIRSEDYKPNWDEIIGKECLWSSPSEVWDDMEANPEQYLPMGSEGSLQKIVWENPKKNSMAAYVITIFGDLREHYSCDQIIDWFKNICENLFVRQATINVINEYYGTQTWSYKYDDK